MRQIISTILLLFSLCSFAIDTRLSLGHDTGNGGDFIAQDFTIYAKKSLEVLENQSYRFPFIDIELVKEAINSAEIKVLPKGDSFNGRIRTAENYPDKMLIIINGDRWERIVTPSRKMALSLHEYFGLLGYEVNNYALTSSLFGIASDEIEIKPSIDELRKSFSHLTKGYDLMLMKAMSLKVFNHSRPQGKRLKEKECADFINKDIRKHESFWHFDSGCYGGYNTYSVLEKSGKNQFGVEYSRILYYKSSYYSTINGSDNWKAYYINREGIIVERHDFEFMFGERVRSVASLNDKGDLYQHITTLTKDGIENENKAIVVLSNGFLGDKVEKIVYPPSNMRAYNSFVTYSVSDAKNWNNFEIYLIDSNGNAPQYTNWNDTNLGLSVSYAYKYFDQLLKTPDNYRSITISSGSKYPQSVSGKYVLNRRVYDIQ
jgi:hypothetical protein